MATQESLDRARKWGVNRLPALATFEIESLADEFDAAGNEALEKLASFVETHYCIIDAERGYPHYKTFAREKHPAEPLAAAIRAMKEQP